MPSAAELDINRHPGDALTVPVVQGDDNGACRVYTTRCLARCKVICPIEL